MVLDIESKFLKLKEKGDCIEPSQNWFLLLISEYKIYTKETFLDVVKLVMLTAHKEGLIKFFSYFFITEKTNLGTICYIELSLMTRRNNLLKLLARIGLDINLVIVTIPRPRKFFSIEAIKVMSSMASAFHSSIQFAEVYFGGVPRHTIGKSSNSTFFYKGWIDVATKEIEPKKTLNQNTLNSYECNENENDLIHKLETDSDFKDFNLSEKKTKRIFSLEKEMKSRIENSFATCEFNEILGLRNKEALIPFHSKESVQDFLKIMDEVHEFLKKRYLDEEKFAIFFKGHSFPSVKMEKETIQSINVYKKIGHLISFYYCLHNVLVKQGVCNLTDFTSLSSKLCPNCFFGYLESKSEVCATANGLRRRIENFEDNFGIKFPRNRKYVK